MGHVLICSPELNGFSFTGVKLELGGEMDPVEYRAVIRFLYLKGPTPQEMMK